MSNITKGEVLLEQNQKQPSSHRPASRRREGLTEAAQRRHSDPQRSQWIDERKFLSSRASKRQRTLPLRRPEHGKRSTGQLTRPQEKGAQMARLVSMSATHLPRRPCGETRYRHLRPAARGRRRHARHLPAPVSQAGSSARTHWCRGTRRRNGRTRCVSLRADVGVRAHQRRDRHPSVPTCRAEDRIGTWAKTLRG